MQTATKKTRNSRRKPRAMKTQFYTIELLFFLSLDVSYEHSEVFPTIFFLSLLIPPFFVSGFFISSRGSYFRGSKTLHIFARTQFFALLYFLLGSYFRVSKMVLIFAGPKNRENKNTRSLKPRNGEPCELFDVYSIFSQCNPSFNTSYLSTLVFLRRIPSSA